jgi:long-chain acyl-CoA synthetase
MSISAGQLLAGPFATLPELIAAHAAERPQHPALRVEERSLDHAALEALTARVAAALQRDGARPGERVATLGGAGIEHLVAIIGALRAGLAVAPMPCQAHPDQIARMLGDVSPTHLFVDAQYPAAGAPVTTRRVDLDEAAFTAWLGSASTPAAVSLAPDSPCNIIYSSGTTGAPKGVVQPHSLRWGQIRRGLANGFDRDAVMLLATPLCSNTTLTGLFSVLGAGGTAVFLGRFDAGRYLHCAEQFGATHTALVPIQYQRILAHPEFDRRDLARFRVKISTGAPLSVQLKQDILRRWPGALHEYYGLTEGGVFTLLDAGAHPDKLHTVGQPPPGYDVRIIDEQGHFLPPGEIGDIVGHSGVMMSEYFGQPEKTAEMEWFAPDGTRYLRSGDLGCFDADGFLQLSGRRKEMIISGGFNVYPKDLEEVLAAHTDVIEVAVAGVPSERWGETPVAWVVLKPGVTADAEALLAWANAKVGSAQRLSEVCVVHALPRNAMDKVVKTELQAAYLGAKESVQQ